MVNGSRVIQIGVLPRSEQSKYDLNEQTA